MYETITLEMTSAQRSGVADSPGFEADGVGLLHVGLEAGWDGEPLPALYAQVGTLTPMDAHVAHQVGLATKCRVAVLTLVGFGVELFVDPLGSELGEQLGAKLTLK